MMVRFTLCIGYTGRYEEIVDLSDNLTEDEIEEEWQSWARDQIEGYWEIKK